MRVENHGQPNSSDKLQVIFNPLVQIPAEQADAGSGSSTSLGLGLYIAHEIVAMHGGSMAAESSEQATVFCAACPEHRGESPSSRGWLKRPIA